ncbi:MAG: UbiD family decarboxylase, partial [Burkholderiales bacterium]|nr:UbiD family decarboxylase [Burkholderiales bacterium]
MKRPAGNPLDLRAWLDTARQLGQLKDVPGADAKLELGAISEMNVKVDGAPALLFDEIPGYPKGFRVVTCTTASPARLSSLLRMPVERSHRGLVQALRGKPRGWQAEAPKYEPVVAETGPVLENTQSGKDVDINIFPSPLWHEKDGGPYIGTGCCVVTKDFDSDWVNVG